MQRYNCLNCKKLFTLPKDTFGEINHYPRHVCTEGAATCPSFYYKRLHRHLYFNSVHTNRTTRKRDNSYCLKMTNKTLKVLCLFWFTIGTVINYIKCHTREDCRVEICRSSTMIDLLSDEQKCTLIIYVLEKIEYDKIIDLLYPPEELLLAGRSENDEIYSTIIENEKAIQRKVKTFLEPDQEISLDGMLSYNTEVLVRRNLLNRTFRMVLDDNMKGNQMCVNGESYKCKLIGLIKRTVDYRTKNQTRCNENNDGTCFITPTAMIILHDVFITLQVPSSELYQDYLHDGFLTPTMIPYYESLLFISAQGLVTWQCEVPPIDDEESDGE